MSKYRITGPDGMTYEVTAPEGATEQEVMSFVMQKAQPSPERTEAMSGEFSPSGATWGAFDNFNSGVLQGMGDEAKAVGASLKAGAMPWFSEEYDQAKSAYQGARQKYTKENPKTAIATDLPGQMLPWVVGAPLMGAVKAGASMPAKIGVGALQGFGVGTVSGGMNAEGDMMDRAKGAAYGGGIGAVTGGIAPPIISGVTKGATAVANQTINRMPFRQKSAAMRKVAEALERDGLTPQQAMARIRQLGPQGALMDVGPNSQALARSAATVPGEGKTQIGNFLTERQEGTRGPNNVLQGSQIHRITDQIDDLVPDNYRQAKQGVVDARKGFGANYDAARDMDDVVDVLPVLKNIDDEIAASKGGIKTALQKVRGYLVDDGGNPEITIDTLHQAKMAIDDLMSGEARSSMGSVAKSRIRAYQDAILDAIENSGPAGAEYRTGRLGTAGQWRIDDALDDGSNFMLKRVFSNSEDMAEQLAKMKPEELHAFRVGAAQALKSKIGDMNVRSDATKRIMDIPELENRISLAFGDDALFSKYISGLKNERTMFDSYGKIMGGSRTGEVIAEQADARVDPGRVVQGVSDIFTPNNGFGPLRGIVNVLGGVKARALMPAPLSRQLGGVLTGPGSLSISDAYRAAQMGEIKRTKLARILAMTGGVGGAATTKNTD